MQSVLHLFEPLESHLFEVSVEKLVACLALELVVLLESYLADPLAAMLGKVSALNSAASRAEVLEFPMADLKVAC